MANLPSSECPLSIVSICDRPCQWTNIFILCSLGIQQWGASVEGAIRLFRVLSLSGRRYKYRWYLHCDFIFEKILLHLNSQHIVKTYSSRRALSDKTLNRTNSGLVCLHPRWGHASPTWGRIEWGMIWSPDNLHRFALVPLDVPILHSVNGTKKTPWFVRRGIMRRGCVGSPPNACHGLTNHCCAAEDHLRRRSDGREVCSLSPIVMTSV